MEGNSRQALLNSFLEGSHGQLDSLRQRHADALERDPLFYAHLSRWYQRHGAIRDHQELFPAHLLCHADSEFRDHAQVLVQTLRPYQLARVARYSKEKLSYPTRALRQAVSFYLKRREDEPAWMDECIMRDRNSLKYLYATFHLKPDARTQSLLFRRESHYASRVNDARRLSAYVEQPEVQARMIREKHIHLTTAIGAIRHYTRDILESLVEVMTPQQLINNLNFLQKRGALQAGTIRERVLNKIKTAVQESRVHDVKALVALQKIDHDPRLEQELFRLAEERLRRRGRIVRPTALFIDKSGSMDVCLEIGRQLAALVSIVCDAELVVEAFDGQSISIRPESRDLAGWGKAFKHIRADGCTSIGCSLAKHRQRRLEQIVLITDGEENTAPLFAEELNAYRRTHGFCPDVTTIKVGKRWTSLEESMKQLGLSQTIIQFEGDYYNLPNVVPRLCQGNDAALVDDVLSESLYSKADLQRLPRGFDPDSCEIL